MIDKESFDVYERALSINAALVQKEVEALVSECNGMTGATLQRTLAQGYQELVMAYGSFAAAAAVEFYAQQRAQAAVGESYEPRQYAPQLLRTLSARRGSRPIRRR